MSSSTPKLPPLRPDYSIGSQPRKTGKRRRPRDEEGDETGSQDEGRVEDGWVEIDKRSMVKRVRNRKLLKAVTDADDVENESDSQSTLVERLDGRLTPPSAQPPSAQTVNATSERQSRHHPTCDGPAVALMFRKFIELCHEVSSLDDNETSERKCCNTCRSLVIQNSGQLRTELERWAVELESVQSHTLGGDVIRPSQIDGISPLKRAFPK